MTRELQPSQHTQHNDERSPPNAHDSFNGVLLIDKHPPKETIEQASKHIFPEGSVQLSANEFCKTFHTRVSGELARGLWYLLGLVVVLHMISVIGFSWRLTDTPTAGDTDRTERIETAIATVSDAAKVLYAVLTPLATAVTGYYFSTGGDSDSERDN
jgi:hypothetical protein